MSDEPGGLPGVPGHELEKAAANVATNAGNSVVRGIANVTGAFFAGWIAKKQATAAAEGVAIETKAQIERADAFAQHERKQELEAIGHSELVQRGLARLGNELIWQQQNFEAIALRAIELAERDEKSDSAREIEDDWMFRFCRFAQDASDNDIRELWAKILSSASMEGRTKISPSALQIMSLIDSKTARDFRQFFGAMKTFDFFPAHDRIYETEAQGIDVRNLEELGLVECDPISGEYPFSDFLLRVGAVGGARIGLLKTSYSLTVRGKEIADAVFSEEDLRLDDKTQQLYLESVVTNQIDVYFSAAVILPPHEGNYFPFALQIMNRRMPPLVSFPISQIRAFASDRLWTLLQWADAKYEILAIGHSDLGRHYGRAGRPDVLSGSD
jgi:hypothetical protein